MPNDPDTEFRCEEINYPSLQNSNGVFVKIKTSKQLKSQDILVSTIWLFG